MSYEFAGAYDAAVLDANSQLLKSTAFELVTEPGGLPATLYTDRVRSAAGPQPFLSDAEGNVHLFTDPGRYRLRQAGQPPGEQITVQPDPDETEGELEAHVVAPDPHPVYLTAAEGNASYDLVGTAASGDAAHVAAGDPHPVYLTQAEGDAAYAPIGGGQFVFVTDAPYNAVGDGVTDDSPAFAAALAASRYVIVPQAPSTYRLASTLDLPEGRTLELLPGARLRPEANPGITLNRDRVRLRGPMIGPEGPVSPEPPVEPNIIYAGPASGVIVDVANLPASAPGGVYAAGLALDATGIAGVTGMRIGFGQGIAWSKFEDMIFTNMAGGVLVLTGAQQMTYRRLFVYTNVTDYSFALRGSGGSGGAITANRIYDSVFNSQARGVICGTSDGVGLGCADAQFVGCNIEAQSESQMEFWTGGLYRVLDCHIENDPAQTQPSIIIGRPGGEISYLEVATCQLNTAVDGPVFEGHGWRSLDIHDNSLVAVGTGAGAPAFQNVGDGSARQAGRWWNNLIYSAAMIPAPEIDSLTGFELVLLENIDGGSIPTPDLIFKGRFKLGAMTPTIDPGASLDLSDAATDLGSVEVPASRGIFASGAAVEATVAANAYGSTSGVFKGAVAGPAVIARVHNTLGFLLDYDSAVVADGAFVVEKRIFQVDPTGLATFAGKANLVVTTALAASLNFPDGTPPAAPVNGDMWVASGVLFVHLGGITRAVDTTP